MFDNKYNLNLDQVFKLDYKQDANIELISGDTISDVIRLKVNNQYLYIKRYYKPSKKFFNNLLLALGLFQSKLSREYNNLKLLVNLGFNVPNIVYYNESKGRACLATEDINSQHYANNNPDNSSISLYDYFHNKQVITDQDLVLIEKFIAILSKLHSLNFIHYDFRLRNTLLGLEEQLERSKLYLIDCPNSFKLDNKLINFILGPLIKYYKLRDLALVYKDLKNLLSVKKLLKLYRFYAKLNPEFINIPKNKDRKNIHLVITYFEK